MIKYNIQACAAIAGHTYHATWPHYAGLSFRQGDKTAATNPPLMNGLVYMVDVPSAPHPAGDFYAALYINFRNGKAEDAVIAVRGTVLGDVSNILTDIYSWYSAAMGSDWFDHVPPYYNQAVLFLLRAREYLRDNFPRISPLRTCLVGHSLGGAIAQLLTLRGAYGYKTVVFNSPGCRDLAGERLVDNQDLVTSVNSHYGIINKIGGLVEGHLTVVDVPNREDEAKAIFQHFNQGDFDQGRTLSQQADLSLIANPAVAVNDTLLSTFYRAEAVSGSSQALEQTAQFASATAICTKDSWLGLIQPLARSACSLETLLKTYGDVIIAQHDIDNMIAALTYSEKVVEVVA